MSLESRIPLTDLPKKPLTIGLERRADTQMPGSMPTNETVRDIVTTASLVRHTAAAAERELPALQRRSQIPPRESQDIFWPNRSISEAVTPDVRAEYVNGVLRAQALATLEADGSVDANVKRQEREKFDRDFADQNDYYRTQAEGVAVKVQEESTAVFDALASATTEQKQRKLVRRALRKVKKSGKDNVDFLPTDDTWLTRDDVKNVKRGWAPTLAINGTSEVISQVLPLIIGKMAQRANPLEALDNKWVNAASAAVAGAAHLWLMHDVFILNGKENIRLLEEKGTSTVFLSKFLYDTADRWFGNKKFNKFMGWVGYGIYHGLWELPYIKGTVDAVTGNGHHNDDLQLDSGAAFLGGADAASIAKNRVLYYFTKRWRKNKN
jgi:hypothetical protein